MKVAGILRRALLVVWLGLPLLALCGADAAPKTQAERPLTQAELDAKIAKLIEQLGAPQFATREKAQAELMRLGLVAFDALHAAQMHDDIEIALRARYLIRSLRVDWSRENDSAEVKRILRSYGDQNQNERKNRMERLGRLEDEQGLPALCRLVRFETSDKLSKFAALQAMQLPQPADKADAGRRSQMIKSAVGLSKRPAAQWMKAYAATLVDPASALPAWNRLGKAEHDLYMQMPEQTDPILVRDLLRWQAELLTRLKRDSDALEVIRLSVALIEENRTQILDAVDWLMKQRAFVVVDDVAARFKETFDKDALLLYRLAESQVVRGEREAGEATANRALALNPTQPQTHNEAGLQLQGRGLRKWSEREFRFVMKLEPPGSIQNLYARFLLSEMLHDYLQEQEAAKVLEGVVNAMDTDANVMRLFDRGFLGRKPGAIRSRMHYFYSQHHAAQNDAEKQRERLQEAIMSDPTDADVLIAMYRVAGDQAWKQMTRQHIDAAVGNFRDQVKNYQRLAARAPNEPTRENYNRQLATAYNQFAWLVGNTYGDYDEAIRFSHKSLELRPDAGGYLDTLGHCYFYKGDYVNAVKYQTRAVALEPHSGQIVRKLDVFKKKLAEEQAKKNNGGN